MGSTTRSDADRAASIRLLDTLNKAHRALGKRVRSALEDADVSPREFAVLDLLAANGPIPLGEIGDAVLLTSGSTTYVVDQLESRGLPERRSCPSDQRVTYGAITDNGRGLLDRIAPGYCSAVRDSMASLTCDEKKACAEMLERLAEPDDANSR